MTKNNGYLLKIHCDKDMAEQLKWCCKLSRRTLSAEAKLRLKEHLFTSFYIDEESVESRAQIFKAAELHKPVRLTLVDDD